MAGDGNAAGIEMDARNVNVRHTRGGWRRGGSGALSLVLKSSGTPEWIRTTDLLLRRQKPVENRQFTKERNWLLWVA